MLNLKKLQTSTALALAIGMSGTAIAPFAATAQTPRIFQGGGSGSVYNGGSNSTFANRVVIPSGNRLRVEYLDNKGEEKDKVLVGLNERLPVTFTVDRDLAVYNNRPLIPRGTKVEGEFQPLTNNGGTRFNAKRLVFADGTKIDINATSNIVGRVERVRRGVSTDALLKGAAIGSGAAAIISAVTGNKRIALGEVLIGTGVGALGGLILGRRNDEVYSVSIGDLDIRLEQPLALNLR